MKFIHSDLGFVQRGDIIEVRLSGSAANVRLLDDINLARYQRGEQHQYFGGLATKSPVRLGVPNAGRWHAVVDMRGLRGTTQASFRRIPLASAQPLPPLQERATSDLAPIAEALQEEVGSDVYASRPYDVFISHASEDKDDVVRPLAIELLRLGLRVWFDEFEMKIGDSLRQKIDRGIADSRFGVVVVSPAFLAKGWPRYELDGLVSRAVEGKQVVLPIWHRIDHEQVSEASPTLADRVALRTATSSISDMALEIATVIRRT